MPRSICLFLVLIILYGCQKDLSHNSANYFSLTDFFEKNQPSQQSFIVDAVNGGTFKSKSGATLWIMPNSFLDQSDQPVTGSIELGLQEIYGAYDMIISNKLTMSDGLPLISGGEFYVKATAKGQKIKLAPYKLVRIDLPASEENLDQMRVFNGQKDNTGNINWKLNTGPDNMVIISDSTIGTANPSHSMYFDSVNVWVNCDQFKSGPFISCSALAGNCPNPDSTQVFVHFTGQHAVVMMFLDNTKSIFSNWELMAEPVTIIAICYQNKQFYSSIISTTLYDQKLVTLNFSETTEAALKERLKNLK